MKTAYFIKVKAGENNNKFYRMTERADGVYCEWGRVGVGKPQTKLYPVGSWDEVYNTRRSHGYLDRTELMQVVKGSFAPEASAGIEQLLQMLYERSRQLAKETYVDPDAITPAQLSQAQALIDELRLVKSVWQANQQLEMLMTVCPRKVARVSDMMITEMCDLNDVVNREQSYLDNLKTTSGVSPQAVGERLSTRLGIEIVEAPAGVDTPLKVGDYVKDHDGRKRGKVTRLFVVRSVKMDAEFAKSKVAGDTYMYWHGSRNENWLNILYQGLQVHPNAVTTGKMFGNGLYFANDAMKSLGYCGLSSAQRWNNVKDDKVYLGLFMVRMGRVKKLTGADQYQSWVGNADYRTMSGKGFDSVAALKGYSHLMNNEFIVYQPGQAAIRYLVEVEAV